MPETIKHERIKGDRAFFSGDQIVQMCMYVLLYLFLLIAKTILFNIYIFNIKDFPSLRF